MNKKFLLFVVTAIALVALFAVQAFAACDPACTADFACKDADGKCNTCGETVTLVEHTWAGDCDLACDVCGETRTSQTTHTYVNCVSAKCSICSAERDTTALAHTYDNGCDIDCNACGLIRTPDAYTAENWKYGEETKLTMANEQLSVTITNTSGGEVSHWWPRTHIEYLIDGDFNTAIITAPTGEQVRYIIALDKTRYVTTVKVYFNTIDAVSLGNGTQSDPNHDVNMDITVKCYDENMVELSSETFKSGGLTEKELTIGKGVKYVTVYPASRWDVKAIVREVEVYSKDVSLDHTYKAAECDTTCEYCLAVARESNVAHTLDFPCKDADGICAVCLESVTLADHTWEAGCDTECDVCKETRVATGTHGLDLPCYDADGKCNVCGVDITVTGAHTSDYACYDADGKCNACEQAITITTDHEWSGVCDDICDICKQTRSVSASHVTDFACYDEDGKCSVCNATVVLAPHTLDTPCNDADSKCNVCNADVTVEGHSWSSDCDMYCNECEEERTTTADHKTDFACYDADSKCNRCDEPIRANAKHKTDKACYDVDGKCNVCSQDVTLAEHEWTGECDTDCGVCGTTRTDVPAHTLDYACKDADGNCNVCSTMVTLASHTYSAECDVMCNVCFDERSDAKAHTTDFACKDADGKCNVCSAMVTLASHTYSADCDTVCDVCGDVREAQAHTTDKACSDADGKCNVCGMDATLAAHTYAFACDPVCDVCEFARADAAAHAYGEFTVVTEATKDVPGVQTRTCSVCGVVETAPVAYEAKLGAGAIVGIAAGSAVVVGAGGFSLFWFVIKKKTWADLIAVFKK